MFRPRSYILMDTNPHHLFFGSVMVRPASDEEVVSGSPMCGGGSPMCGCWSKPHGKTFQLLTVVFSKALIKLGVHWCTVDCSRGFDPVPCVGFCGDLDRRKPSTFWHQSRRRFHFGVGQITGTDGAFAYKK